MEAMYQTYRRNDRLNCSCAFAAGDLHVQIYHDIDEKWMYLTYDNWSEVVIERASDHMTVMKKVDVRADRLGSTAKNYSSLMFQNVNTHTHSDTFTLRIATV